MSKRSNRRSRRDISLIAKPLGLPRPSPVRPVAKRATRQMSLGLFPEVEDRRFYHPLGTSAPAASFKKPRHTLAAGKPFSPKVSPLISAFSAPSGVLICVRRKQRKEVLHALQKTGKVGQRRPRRSEFSSVQC